MPGTPNKSKGTQTLKSANRQVGKPNSTKQRPAPNKKQESSLSVKAPVASARVRTMRTPLVLSGKNGDVVIRHREYITDILGSVAFASNSFSVNPGLPGTFPWLSRIAQNYESYLFRRLCFDFETEAPTSATGTVLLALDYDASDPAPENKTQAMSYRSAVRSPPWSDSSLLSLKEDLSKRQSFFVRSGGLSANQDIKLYDVGNLFVCLQGEANANTVGELYVEYEIQLITPQMGPPSIGSAVSGVFSGVTNAAPFATSVGNLPATVVSTGTTTSVSTWTFTQPWQGTCSIGITGTGLAGTAGTGTATSIEYSDTGTTTSETVIYTLNAAIGQTFIVTIGDTTISAISAFFMQGDI